MRQRVARLWRWTRASPARRIATALLVGSMAALVVLAFDVRARVDGQMTYCGNGVIGVHVPLFDDASEEFYSECDAAIRRWRAAAAAVGGSVSLLVLATGELMLSRGARAA